LAHIIDLKLWLLHQMFGFAIFTWYVNVSLSSWNWGYKTLFDKPCDRIILWIPVFNNISLFSKSATKFWQFK
jgi:hypothetical protein